MLFNENCVTKKFTSFKNDLIGTRLTNLLLLPNLLTSCLLGKELVSKERLCEKFKQSLLNLGKK